MSRARSAMQEKKKKKYLVKKAAILRIGRCVYIAGLISCPLESGHSPTPVKGEHEYGIANFS